MTAADKAVEAAMARAEAATPGPWEADVAVRGDCVVWGPNGRFIANTQAEPHWVLDENGKKRSVVFDVDRRDCEFIAHARTDIPMLLDLLAERDAELVKLRAELADAQRYTSTACHHQRHDDCRLTCKWCPEACRCACHTAAGENGGTNDD